MERKGIAAAGAEDGAGSETSLLIEDGCFARIVQANDDDFLLCDREAGGWKTDKRRRKGGGSMCARGGESDYVERDR